MVGPKLENGLENSTTYFLAKLTTHAQEVHVVIVTCTEDHEPHINH